MNKAIYGIAPLFLFAMATGAFAQGEKVTTNKDMTETVKVTVTGGLDLDWVWRDRALTASRGAFGFYGFGPGDSGREEGIVHAHANVRLDVDLSEKVRVALKLENKRFEAGAVTDALGTGVEGLGVIIREATITLSEVFDPGVTIMAGANTWAWSVRDEGGSMFWDPAHSGTITGNVASALPGGTGASGMLRDELQPTGVVVMYNRESIHFTLALLPAIVEAGSAAADEAGYVAALTYDLTQLGKGSKVGGILAISSSGFAAGAGSSASESTMFTVGGGASLKDMGMPGLEIFGEFYFQGGTIGTVPSATGNDSVDVGGIAFSLGAKYVIQNNDMMPWVQFKLDFLSGDDDQTAGDTDCDAWLSYESIADLMILEDAFYGVNWNSNLFAIKLSGGASLSVGKGKNNLAVSAILGITRTNEDVTVAVGQTEDALGTEFDVKATYWFSKQVSLDAGVGLVFGSDVMDGLLGNPANDPDADDSAMLFTIGMNAKF